MTSTHTLRISGTEVVRLLRDEIASTMGQPELNLTISKEYIRRKALRRRPRNADSEARPDLVSEFTLLTIEPRRERDYWILRVEINRPVGLRSPYDEHGMGSSRLTVDEFEEKMRSPGDKRIRLRLEMETPVARRHFDRWLSEMRKRHPPPAKEPPTKRPLTKKQAQQRAAAPTPPSTSSTRGTIKHDPPGQRQQAMARQESVGSSAVHVGKLLPVARKKLVMLQSDVPLIKAALLLMQKEANLVVICNSGGTLAGVVAKTDIVREFCKRRRSNSKISVSVAMTRKVVSCWASDYLIDVWSTMNAHGLKHVPIVDPDNRPIGLAIARDVLGTLLEEAEYEEHILRDYVMSVGYH